MEHEQQTKHSARPAQNQKPAEQKPTEQKPVVPKKIKSEKLAEKRTSAVLEKIRLLGNLASPNYVLTTGHKKQIIAALENAIGELDGRFEQSYIADKQCFRFEMGT